MGKSVWGRFRVALSSGVAGIISPVKMGKVILYLCCAAGGPEGSLALRTPKVKQWLTSGPKKVSNTF
jgi:hypothetical protein